MRVIHRLKYIGISKLEINIRLGKETHVSFPRLLIKRFSRFVEAHITILIYPLLPEVEVQREIQTILPLLYFYVLPLIP